MTQFNLSIEQEYKLRVLEHHISSIDQEQLKNLILKAIKQMMIKDNCLKTCHYILDQTLNSHAPDLSYPFNADWNL